VRFKVLTVVGMMFRVFWDVALCSHVEVERQLITLMMDAIHTSEILVNFNVTDYTALHARRV
jgi:hypothetical protein